MKKSYDSMDAYKVVFNANEQVYAKCNVFDTGSKYDASRDNPAGTMIVCTQNAGNKYGMADWGADSDMCVTANITEDMMKYAD